MRTDIIMRGGRLEIPGWHNHAKEVLLADGISTCISVQSNNLLQKIIVEDARQCRAIRNNTGNENESERTDESLPWGYGKDYQGELPQGQP